MKNNYGIWDLEQFIDIEPNDYKNVIDKTVRFDYKNRECAIATLFKTTKDPNVKQVLKFAMELNNQYRTEALNLYNTLSKVNDNLKLLSDQTLDVLIDVYL